jgi:dolichol-phosphate mannosyltransferase
MPPSMDAPNETTTADRRRSPVVSIISPTYNEALNVGPLIDGLHAALVDVAHEVIIVDDDSPDGTWEIVEALAATDARVRVIRRFGESGLSSAVLAGMEVATGSVLAVIDADGQHDEAALPEMVRRIEHGEADVVVGTRGAEGGSYGEFSLGRRIVSGVAALLAKLFPARPGVGPDVGVLRDLSRHLPPASAPTINPQGFKILLEFHRSPGATFGSTRSATASAIASTARPR